MTTDRILLLGGVGLVKGRIKGAGSILVEVCDQLDPILHASGFIRRAPFRKLSGIIRFGTRHMSVPEIGPVDERTSTLPFSVEVEMASLRRADRSSVKRAFLGVTLEALLEIASRHGLPTRQLEDLKREAEGAP